VLVILCEREQYPHLRYLKSLNCWILLTLEVVSLLKVGEKVEPAIKTGIG